VLVGATSAALSAYHISRRPIWNDEGVSIGMATMPMSSWLVALRHEPNMVLYYAALRVWMLFGQSEAAIRSLSAIAAVTSVLLLFVLLRRLFRTPEALLGSALLATNGCFIRYAQEARSYALLTMVVVAAMIAFTGWVRNSSRGGMVLFVLLSAAAFYLQVLSVLVFGAAMITAFVSPVRKGIPYALLLYGILTAPMLRLTLRGHELLSWIPFPRWSDLTDSANDYCGHAGEVVAAVYLFILIAFTILICQRVMRREGVWAWVLLLLWCVMPAAVMLGMTLFGHPLFVVRFVLMSLPALTAVVAVVVCRLPCKYSAVAATALICTSLYGEFKWSQEHDETDDMRSVTEYIGTQARATDAVVVYWPQSAFSYQYYANRSSLRQLPLAFPLMQFPESVTVAHNDAIDRDVLRQSDRVWFIVDTLGKDGADAAFLANSIKEDFPLVADERDFVGFSVTVRNRAPDGNASQPAGRE
jgi:mannosyltransferase